MKWSSILIGLHGTFFFPCTFSPAIWLVLLLIYEFCLHHIRALRYTLTAKKHYKNRPWLFPFWIMQHELNIPAVALGQNWECAVYICKDLLLSENKSIFLAISFGKNQINHENRSASLTYSRRSRKTTKVTAATTLVVTYHPGHSSSNHLASCGCCTGFRSYFASCRQFSFVRFCFVHCEGFLFNHRVLFFSSANLY